MHFIMIKKELYLITGKNLTEQGEKFKHLKRVQLNDRKIVDTSFQNVKKFEQYYYIDHIRVNRLDADINSIIHISDSLKRKGYLDTNGNVLYPKLSFKYQSLN